MRAAPTVVLLSLAACGAPLRDINRPPPPPPPGTAPTLEQCNYATYTGVPYEPAKLANGWWYGMAAPPRTPLRPELMLVCRCAASGWRTGRS
jgi:hypothetical protein